MNLKVHVVHFMYKSFPSFLNSCLVSYVCPFIVFVNRKSVFNIYSVNQNVFIHFVPAKTSLVSVIITKMNVVFFYFFAIFVYIHLYQALYTYKIFFGRKLTPWSSTWFFSWIFEKFLLHVYIYMFVLSRHCIEWLSSMDSYMLLSFSFNKLMIEMIF